MATLTSLVLPARCALSEAARIMTRTPERRGAPLAPTMRVLIFEERPGSWAIVAPFPERPRGTETDAVTLARHFYPRSEVIVRRINGQEARYAVAP